MKIKMSFIPIAILSISSHISQAATISQEQLLGTWRIKNQTADPLYSGTKGKVTFHQDGTITVNNGAFAAAGIFANEKYGNCAKHEGPIRYKKIGKGEFYLYWKGQQINSQDDELEPEGYDNSTEELDSIIKLINKEIKTKYDIQHSHLTFIGQGGCATDPGVVKISYLKKEFNEPVLPPMLSCKELLYEDASACKEDFFHTGNDQLVTVPPGAKYMKVKVWGAGGNGDNGSRGGVGGYTTAVIPVSEDDEYAVVVGRWGNNGGSENYGFGGTGGGLSGIFMDTDTVLDSDQARAIIVAGGGGAGSDGSSEIRNGRNGNDQSNLTVDDSMAADCRIGRGGGGGGYAGGQLSSGFCSTTNRRAFGYGGSGFITSIAEPLFSSIETGSVNCPTGAGPRIPANYLDEDWQRVATEPCRGPGAEESFSNRGAAVIIEWLDEIPL